MLLVSLVPDLFAVQRIALFDQKVYILYLAEIARNSGLLLLSLRSVPLKLTFASRLFLEVAQTIDYK